MAGWIKLYRQLLDSPVFSNEKYLKVWVYILLKANHQPNTIIRAGKSFTIETGSFITGRKRLSEELNIPASTVERILSFFENEHQIGQQKTNKDRLITVTKWSSYQGSEQPNGQQMDNKWTTDGQQMDTNKNIKNDKINTKKENMIKRKTKFIEEVEKYVAEHPQYLPVKDRFIDYWTEATPSGTKFLKEKRESFEIGKRLGHFLSRNNEYKKAEPKNSGSLKEKDYVPKF